MSIEDLAQRTWKVPRVLSTCLVGLGSTVVLGGLVAGVPPAIAIGASLFAGGAFSLWSLKTKEAGFQALLSQPERVERLIPVVVKIQGVARHYPVVVVADDGRAYRIGTWTRSVREALLPFLQRFPHASLPEGNDVYAPDDGVEARLRGIGVVFGSAAVGVAFAALMVLPMTLTSLKIANEGYARRLAHVRAEREALDSVAHAAMSKSWSECALGRDPFVPVVVDGAQARSWSSLRVGWLRSGRPLSLDVRTDDFQERPSFPGKLVDALTGSKLEWTFGATHPTSPPEPVVVGYRHGDSLALRLVDLSDGKVSCEGLAPVAPATSEAEENRALAAAVMIPFCAQLTPEACGDDVSGAARLTRSCYESSKAPKLRGAVNVEYTIGPSGRVISVKSTGSTNARLDQCVRKVFQDLRFSPPETGSLTAMKSRLSFDP